MAIPAAVPPPARAVVTSGAVRESYSLICQPCCLRLLNEVSVREPYSTPNNTILT